MRLKVLVAVSSLLLGFLGTTVAEDDSRPLRQTAESPAPVPVPSEQQDDWKLPFALYVQVGGGIASADPLDPSIKSAVSHVTSSQLNLEDQQNVTAAIGWKFPDEKGDVRLSFNGFKEDGYLFTSVAAQSTIDPAFGTPSVLDNLDWWTVRAEDGDFRSIKSPPQWTDGNGNGFVERSEVFYLSTPTVDIGRRIADDLQNRAQTVDLMYGREFGRRRYSSRWWSGLRYFAFEGNVPATAWLNVSQPGDGFTDGLNLRLLDLPQQTTGWGPTGSLEADFNFYDKRLQFFLKGQVAFLVLSLETDTGPFFTLAADTINLVMIPAPARLNENRTKSTWQTMAEAGARVRLKNGIHLEMSYHVTGMLDVVLLPTQLQIPTNFQEAAQGTSALFNTQDYVFDGWRAGFAFQF